MSKSLTQVEEQALSLIPEERAKLAELLLESLSAPIEEIEAEWAQEIEQRVAAYDRGEIPTYPAEDVFAEAKRIGK